MSAPYAAEMVEIATRLWGAPSETHSTAKETRFGSNGSKSIDLGKAVWFDHEADTGGNYRELFKLANGVYPTNGEDRSAVFRAPAGMVKELGNPVTWWDYHDAAGASVLRVVRFEPAGADKTFRQCRPDGDRWIWKLNGLKAPLYHLPELLAAASDSTVYITEGEKHADLIWAWGFLATTNAGGAKKFRPDHARALAAFDCVVLPDNDAAGSEHEAVVTREMRAAGCTSIRVLNLPDLPPKGDIIDWVKAGGTRAAFVQLAADARPAPEKTKGNGADHAAEADLPGATIIVQNGLRHEAADAGLLAMRKACVEFYQRDRALVRVCAVNAKASDGTVVTSPGIVNVTLPMLCRALGKSAWWAKLDKDGNQRRIDPPKEVVEQIGGMLGEWPFDSLTGVIGTQTLRPDGSRLFTEGYDAATGLYLLAPNTMPLIPEKPTKQDAVEALALLDGLLVDFPFADNASRSVAISMLMTPVLRGALPPAVPIHAVTAPEAGTGKSYLMDTASAIANGERCAVQSVAPKEDETEKRLIGAALAGLPIIALDNCNGILSGDFLAQVSERPSMRVRPLGGSGLVRLSNTFTTFVNGNNLTIAADLTRRTIRCCLDAETDDTTGRTYSGDPVATVLADRGRYVAAVLTIALAYLAAGEPNPPRPLPSFERWSRIVCGSLTWLGWENPMDTMSDVRADDPSRQQLAAVLEAWPRDLTSYTTGELVDAATECHSDGSGPMNPAWLDAVKEVGRDRRGNIDAIQLGNWLRDHRDRMSGSRKLVRDGTPTRPRWKVAV